ncbi:MAG TPA: 3-deoxy-manno-octulosonate cytidylyltransferase [Flavobacteriales bacterium]|nr:3-deoxy-manno-octulosonate cytidylyltransferase [Flavobacteriales bacterium]
MRIIGIIPARYASTRLPGKPLKMLGDTSLIMRVYNQCKKAATLDEVMVATDDQRIEEHVKKCGGRVIMTSVNHESGTERCLEAVNALNEKYDYVMNIQGDEPFISPVQIDQLANICDGNTQIGTLYKRISSQKELEDENIPKVVLGENGNAVYFSRSPVPHRRGIEKSKWMEGEGYLKHIGIYAYRLDILATIAGLKPSKAERMEQLEQLRWLTNGYDIRAVETDIENLSVDTQGDLEDAIRYLNEFKAI